MKDEHLPIDKAVRRYAPKYPRRQWIKKASIGILIGWLVGVFAYGIPLTNRATNVSHGEVVVAQNGHYNDLIRMVAGLEATTNQGNLGDLASLLRQLRGSGYPNMVALKGYHVYPGEFARASALVGGGLTTQDNPKTDYGKFDGDLLNDVVEAVPGQVSHAYLPTHNVRSWGNFRWQYLALVSAGLWAIVGLVWLLFVLQRKIWEARARRRFTAGMEYEDRVVLQLVNRVLQHPARPGYVTHLDQADRLFALVQRRGEDPRADPDRDVDDELAQLQAIYGDSK